MKKSIILLFLLLSNLVFGEIQESELKFWVADLQQLFNSNNGTVQEWRSMFPAGCVLGHIVVQNDGKKRFHKVGRAASLRSFRDRHKWGKAVYDVNIVSIKITRGEPDYATIVIGVKRSYPNIDEMRLHKTIHTIETIILTETPSGLKLKKLTAQVVDTENLP